MGWPAGTEPALSPPLGLTLILSKKRTGCREEGRRHCLLSAAHPGVCNGTGRSLPSPDFTEICLRVGMRVSLLPDTLHSRDFWVVCGYDSDLSLASYSDLSSPLLDLRKRRVQEAMAVWGCPVSRTLVASYRCATVGQSCCLDQVDRWEVGVYGENCPRPLPWPSQ